MYYVTCTMNYHNNITDMNKIRKLYDFIGVTIYNVSYK